MENIHPCVKESDINSKYRSDLVVKYIQFCNYEVLIPLGYNFGLGYR